MIAGESEMLERPAKGKSFTECTDLKTLQPTKEWQDIYDRVWKELEDLGLPRYYFVASRTSERPKSRRR